MMLRLVFLNLFLLCFHSFRVNGLIQFKAKRSARSCCHHRHLLQDYSSVLARRIITDTTTSVPVPSTRTNLHPELQSSRGGGGGENDSAAAPLRQRPALHSLFRELVAEALGTFLIVQLGTGAVMSAIFTNALVNIMQIASISAVAVILAIYSTRRVSGAHLNPAVTIALAVYRNFSKVKVVPYILAQLVGAMLGSSVNYLLYQHHIRTFEAARGLVRSTAVESAKAFGEYFTDSCSPWVALLAEAVGTFVLTVVIFALTHPRQNNKDNDNVVVPVPVWIGVTVAANICVIGPITQAGLNPARDFGPRIVAYFLGWNKVAFQGAWVYIVGPILGAIFGGFLVDRVLLFRPKSSSSSGSVVDA